MTGAATSGRQSKHFFRATAAARTKAVQMYRCELCQGLQPAGTPSTLIPTRTRQVPYPPREAAHPPLPSPKTRSARKRPNPRRDDPGGHGFETVQERRCCPSCAETATADTGRQKNSRSLSTETD